MPFMVWNDKLSVGVAAVDADHRKLVAMINELYDGIAEGRGREALGSILDDLVAYTRFHFAREEKLFAATGYPGAVAHKKEHDSLTAQVLEIQERFRSGSLAAPSLEVLVFLKDWLFDHIIGSDRDFGPHLNAVGTY